MCMNFITNLLELQRYDAILVMVERFAKLAHVMPIVGIATALETAWPILERWWTHHELPKMIVLD